MSGAAAIEAFIYRSFRLLDEGEFESWLALWDSDAAYIVTTRADLEKGSKTALVNDDRDRLVGRIEQIRRWWHAEAPRTRTLHHVTNIEIEPRASGQIAVYACFTVVATRRGRQDVFVGRYRDILRLVGDGIRIVRREAVLENDMIETGKISFIV